MSVALLTVYDMCKAVDKSMEIGDIYLEHKSGGKSGEFHNQMCGTGDEQYEGCIGKNH